MGEGGEKSLSACSCSCLSSQTVCSCPICLPAKASKHKCHAGNLSVHLPDRERKMQKGRSPRRKRGKKMEERRDRDEEGERWEN